MKASPWEKEDAAHEDIPIIDNHVPKSFVVENGVLKGMTFEKVNIDSVKGQFSRAFLNPPFSQEGEPERDFIDTALEALQPGGLIAVPARLLSSNP